MRQKGQVLSFEQQYARELDVLLGGRMLSESAPRQDASFLFVEKRKNKERRQSVVAFEGRDRRQDFRRSVDCLEKKVNRADVRIMMIFGVMGVSALSAFLMLTLR